MKPRRAKLALGIDPALAPFLDALAGLLAAQEQRLSDGRRVIRAAATQPNQPKQVRKSKR